MDRSKEVGIGIAVAVVAVASWVWYRFFSKRRKEKVLAKEVIRVRSLKDKISSSDPSVQTEGWKEVGDVLSTMQEGESDKRDPVVKEAKKVIQELYIAQITDQKPPMN